jgi:hypothetical protein
MFGDLVKSVSIFLDYDPAADDDIGVFRAPHTLTLKGARFWTVNALAGSTANYFDLALLNGGTAGTATDAIAGTIGGTAGWSANTPTAFTISDGAMTAGELVVLRYNEEGTGTFTAGVLQLDYVDGVGANA